MCNTGTDRIYLDLHAPTTTSMSSRLFLVAVATLIVMLPTEVTGFKLNTYQHRTVRSNASLLTSTSDANKTPNRSTMFINKEGANSSDGQNICDTSPTSDFSIMQEERSGALSPLSRRKSLTRLAVFGVAFGAVDWMDPIVAAASSAKPEEFTSVGTQAPPPTPDDKPFVTLESGVKVKDFRIGTGDSSITSTSQRVNIQCSGRLLNLNGVMFYNTKNNNPDGFGAIPLIIDLGKGQALPGLEQGLIGMKKGGIRRIIIPQELAYNKYPDLEPQPTNANDQRALDSVVKNPRRDGAILFDVQVERFK